MSLVFFVRHFFYYFFKKYYILLFLVNLYLNFSRICSWYGSGRPKWTNWLQVQKEVIYFDLIYFGENFIISLFSGLKRKVKDSTSTEKHFLCNQCDYVTHLLDNLRHHKKYKHEGILYPCVECEYVTSRADNLKLHKESKHKGIRYSCGQCDYSATRSTHLKRHIQNKHEGVRYPCNLCNYEGTEKGSLKRHVKRHHESERDCEVGNFFKKVSVPRWTRKKNLPWDLFSDW